MLEFEMGHVTADTGATQLSHASAFALDLIIRKVERMNKHLIAARNP